MGKYFGTDGVRGQANGVLTPRLAYRIGRFIGQYPLGKKNKILLGRDTRLSGAMLDSALIAGITSSGGDVYQLLETTTPSVSYLVEKHSLDFGIMISASHNPFMDNGIKIFAPNGEKLSHDIELLIEDYIDRDNDDLLFAGQEKIGRVIYANNFKKEYLDYLQSKAEGDFSKLKVAIDCAHGSASTTARELFIKRLHMNATLLNDKFNGLDINQNCGSTHLDFLCKKVKDGGFDLGIAFDGDADRCLLVNHLGETVDGDAILYICGCAMQKEKKLYDNKIVMTVMSNFGFKKSLKKQGIDYEEVPVGDKYVQALLKDKHLSLGGEQSGHIIFNDDLNTGDGQLTAIHMLNILVKENKSLVELTKGLKVYPQLLKNVSVFDKEKIMNDERLKKAIQNEENLLGGNGRILVRPSGTEQLIRVMVEAPLISTCEDIVNRLVNEVEKLNA